SRPLLVFYGGKYYYPLFQFYSEKTFGGIFDTEADYSDPVIKKEFAKAGNWVIYPPIPWDYKAINFNPELKHPSPPSTENWLGTDNRGRDVLSRLIYGFRISLLFALVLASVNALIGILIGSIEGYFGGKVDLIIQRIIEIWMSIPSLYALILIASIFQRSLVLMIVVLSLWEWVGPQSLIRVEFLRSRNLDYVKAARALGVSDLTIMGRHILPNALTMVITGFPFSIKEGMVALVGLDFLGLGVPPPTPSFGEGLAQALDNINAWWIGVPIITVLVMMILLVNFVGEATLEVFDPKRR
ncbi:MAG: ABC transporter permease, partial [Oligoflexales bacterium]|nr:ABC transporter permease [Oligoflexales bacterium]